MTSAGTDPGRIDITRERAITLGTLMAGVLDPMTALLAAQTAMRDSNTASRESELRGAKLAAKSEQVLKAHDLDKAMKALTKAKPRIPKWAKKLIAAVLTVVGTVASVVSGGTTLVLAAVALALLLAAKGVEKMAEKGWIEGPVALGISAVLKIAAAVCMSVTGNTSGLVEVAKTVKTVAEVVKMVNDIVTQVKDLAVGIREVRRGKLQFQADTHQLNAAEHQVRTDEALERMEGSVDEIIKLQERFRKVLQRLMQATEENETATSRALARLGTA